MRKRILARDQGLCQVCLRLGRIELAREVDHLLAKAEGGTDDESNLQAICRQCHAVKTAFEAAAPTGKSLPEWLPSSLIPVIVVCGPPGSGKSAYVNQHAEATDLVLDIDVMAAQHWGKPLYHATEAERIAMVRVRNALLAALARPGMKWRRAWLIVTAGTPGMREFWRRKYGELVTMSTAREECIARIEQDTRRPARSRAAAIEVARGWW